MSSGQPGRDDQPWLNACFDPTGQNENQSDARPIARLPHRYQQQGPHQQPQQQDRRTLHELSQNTPFTFRRAPPRSGPMLGPAPPPAQWPSVLHPPQPMWIPIRPPPLAQQGTWVPSTPTMGMQQPWVDEYPVYTVRPPPFSYNFPPQQQPQLQQLQQRPYQPQFQFQQQYQYQQQYQFEPQNQYGQQYEQPYKQPWERPCDPPPCPPNCNCPRARAAPGWKPNLTRVLHARHSSGSSSDRKSPKKRRVAKGKENEPEGQTTGQVTGESTGGEPAEPIRGELGELIVHAQPYAAQGFRVVLPSTPARTIPPNPAPSQGVPMVTGPNPGHVAPPSIRDPGPAPNASRQPTAEFRPPLPMINLMELETSAPGLRRVLVRDGAIFDLEPQASVLAQPRAPSPILPKTPPKYDDKTEERVQDWVEATEAVRDSPPPPPPYLHEPKRQRINFSFDESLRQNTQQQLQRPQYPSHTSIPQQQLQQVEYGTPQNTTSRPKAAPPSYYQHRRLMITNNPQELELSVHIVPTTPPTVQRQPNFGMPYTEQVPGRHAPRVQVSGHREMIAPPPLQLAPSVAVPVVPQPPVQPATVREGHRHTQSMDLLPSADLGAQVDFPVPSSRAGSADDKSDLGDVDPRELGAAMTLKTMWSAERSTIGASRQARAEGSDPSKAMVLWKRREPENPHALSSPASPPRNSRTPRAKSRRRVAIVAPEETPSQPPQNIHARLASFTLVESANTPHQPLQGQSTSNLPQPTVSSELAPAEPSGSGHPANKDGPAYHWEDERAYRPETAMPEEQ